MNRKSWFLIFTMILVLLCTGASADLQAPGNVGWKTGSTATAQWDAVAGANYYAIRVRVYHNNEFIGEEDYGTGDCEVDLQAQIYSIVGDQQFESVEVSYMVAARNISSNGTISSSFSDESNRINYRLTVLQTPQNVSINDQGVLSWDTIDGATHFSLTTICKKDNIQLDYSPSGYIDSFSTSGTRSYADINETVQEMYTQLCAWKAINKGDTIEIAISMDARVIVGTGDNTRELCSAFSAYSNSYSYANANVFVLGTPQNVSISDQGILSWDTVEGATEFSLTTICTKDNVQLEYSPSGFINSFTTSGTRSFADINDTIKDIYTDLCSWNAIKKGDTIGIAFSMDARMMVYHDDGTGLQICSDFSAYSNYYSYSDADALVLGTPQNVSISDQGILSWDTVEGATEFSLTTICTKDNVRLDYSPSGFINSFTTSGTRSYADINNIIKDMYTDLCTWNAIKKGDTIVITFSMDARMYVGSGDTMRQLCSSFSDYSNGFTFNGEIPVREIQLSPSNPILYNNNTMYLGITIVPENAVYNSVQWTTSNAEVAQVNGKGLITGVAPGEATITATIGDVTASVPINVYTIESNLENGSDWQIVTDTAGDILDDIANNDNPDISATDIQRSDLQDTRDEIHAAVENGDEFRSDIVQEELAWSDVADYWDEIQALVPDGEFAGGLDVSIEVTHQGDGGAAEHIANITELDREIGFEFEATATGEEQADIVVVRIHDGDLTVIAAEEQENGFYMAESDLFSDFVILRVNKTNKEDPDPKKNPDQKETENNPDPKVNPDAGSADPEKETENDSDEGTVLPVIPLGQSGWVHNGDGSWSYGDQNGNAVQGTLNIGGVLYCFNDQGKMITGWGQSKGKWYYADTSGAVCHNGWKYIDGLWYYFRQSGAMATGWVNDGGAWYYLKSSGALATGWIQYKGCWYYLKATGEMATGWLKYNNEWYYMRDSGVMATGWLNDGGIWYYMKGSGVMATGWVQVQGRWYYLKSGGALATGWVKDGGAWYYMSEYGDMVTGWVSSYGNMYYMKASGAMAYGWIEYEGSWYYLKDSGAMATGWLLYGNSWYYMSPEGIMLTGWQEINGKRYCFESDGRMSTGWKQTDGGWLYFDSNGNMATGWKLIDGKWEMFSEEGVWQYTWNGT